MPIINLRKYYYPTIRKDAFVEVSGEVAEALEEGLRIERRQEKKKLYHKVFSMDTNDWTQLHISIYAQSPEDVLLRAEEHAEQERNLSRMAEAFAHRHPTYAAVFHSAKVAERTKGGLTHKWKNHWRLKRLRRRRKSASWKTSRRYF